MLNQSSIEVSQEVEVVRRDAAVDAPEADTQADAISEVKAVAPKHPELADELKALAQAVQDETKSVRLREIIKQIGWPTISKVGSQASEAAFQIALNANHDHELQSNCETFLLGRRAFAPGEINEDNIAIIQEVVRKFAIPQSFQNLVLPYTLEEVNKGRAKIGQPPLTSLLPDGLDTK